MIRMSGPSLIRVVSPGTCDGILMWKMRRSVIRQPMWLAKVALVVGTTPENIMFAGSAVKDAPHHVSVPSLVYTGFPGQGHICRQTDLHMFICGSQQPTQL